MIEQLSLNMSNDYIVIIYFIIVLVIALYLHAHFQSKSIDSFIMLIFFIYAIVSASTNLFNGIGFMAAIVVFFIYIYLRFKTRGGNAENESV